MRTAGHGALTPGPRAGATASGAPARDSPEEHPMTCRRCRRLLSPHLDNALGADERSWVIAHLAQCPACAELLRQLQSNRQLLRALPTVEVARGMELRLQSTIRGSDSRARRSPASI